jgi:hypothetical protein
MRSNSEKSGRHLFSCSRSLDGVLLLDSVDPFLFMVYLSFFLCLIQTVDDWIFSLFDINCGNVDMSTESASPREIRYTSFDLKVGLKMLQKKRRVNIPSCRYERTLGQLPYHLFSESEMSKCA